MVVLKTSRLYNDNAPNVIDVTVKSAKDFWRHLAPTWEMVMAFTKGRITWETYTLLYTAILDSLPNSVWELVAAKGYLNDNELVFGCYCTRPDYCHRKLLCEYMVRHFPNQYIYVEEVPYAHRQ